MSKRMLINYLLLVLIIIFTYIGIKYPIREDQLINRNAITSLKPGNITDIKIETADDSIELQKQGPGWRIVSPIAWYANNIAAERLAMLVAVEPQSKLPEQEIDLSSLGLRIPRAVLTLNQKVFYFGDTNRIGNRRYLMLEPNVYLVNDLHYPFISQGLSGLSDTRLLPPLLALQTIQFNTFKLYKEGPDWKTESNDKSAEKITQLVNNWQNMQASAIKPFKNTQIPLHKISAQLQNNETIEFHLLAIKPEIVIARPDLKLQYHFPDHQYYELLSLDQPAE